MCELATARIRAWTGEVRRALEVDDDVDRITALLERRGAKEYREDSGEKIDMERYDVLSSVRMNAMGLIRYWKRRAERDAAALEEIPIAIDPQAPS